ncbi:MAG: GrpB family protein [Pseudomonadota bacterium]
MHNFVVPHDPAWSSRFADEAAAIRSVLGRSVAAIHHIGSTSIDGILAKPIIDILLETPSLAELDREASGLAALGYEGLGAFGIRGRRYFRKDNGEGVRTHQIHAFRNGTSHIVRHLAFRDFLRAHPEKARAYSDLKATLVERPGMTRELYMDGKDPFIKRTEAEAVAWYKGQGCI